jgi:hypothetical protein
MWTLGGVLLAGWRTSDTAVRLFENIARHASGIVLGIMAAIATLFIVVSLLQVHYFPLGVHAEDTAYYPYQ